MTRRKKDKPRRLPSKQAQKLQAVYAKSRREFRAADLQKFTVVDKGIPLDEVIAEMERIQQDSKPQKA